MVRMNGGGKEQTKDEGWEPWEGSSEHRDSTSAGLGAKSKEDDLNGELYFHHVSYFVTTTIPSKNNIPHRKHMYWQLVAMFVNTGAIRTNPATVTTLTERGLLRQNDTNLESPVPTTMWPPKLP